MRCPSCGSDDTGVLRTYGAQGRELPGELRGLVLMRRRRACFDCNGRFFTIEMPEEDFDELRKPANLVPATFPRVTRVIRVDNIQAESLALLIRAAPRRLREDLEPLLAALGDGRRTH